MKATRSLLVMALMSALAIGCGGDAGPAGPPGADGTDGPAGNANVQLYQFGSQTFTGAMNYTLSVSQATIDSSVVLAYYNPSTEAPTSWYPVPGLGSGALYETRSFFFQSAVTPSTYTYSLRLVNPGTGAPYASAVTFTKVRVFVIPASSVTAAASVQPAVDLNDYHAVSRHFGVRD